MNQLLPLLNRFCSGYIRNITMANKDFTSQVISRLKKKEGGNFTPQPYRKIPNPNRESELLSPEKWAFLYFMLPKMEMCSEVTQLYNSRDGGFSFNRVAQALVGYPVESVIIFTSKHEDQLYTFGVYNPEELKDYAKFRGSNETCLFCLDPEVRC